jgi:signal transduction histidine kinase
MRQTAHAAGTNEGASGDRKRVETVVEALATLRSRGESLSEVAHDARNMVAALGLYCDLLDEPGVLAAPYAHYGNELRLVAAASRRLVEKLVELDAHAAPEMAPPALFEVSSGRGAVAGAAKARPERGPSPNLDPSLIPNLDRNAVSILGPRAGHSSGWNRRWDLLPALPVSNLAAELLGSRNLLSALAGPSIGLTMDADGGARPVRLTGEDLTRVLVNLVKNAAEAMPEGGRIRIGLCERPAAEGSAACVVLKIEDNGPGIPEEAVQRIFASGYTTHGKDERERGGWPLSHRGLGLAIARSIVETAGGRISARNREQGGACFEIELPVRETSR